VQQQVDDGRRLLDALIAEEARVARPDAAAVECTQVAS